MRSDVPYLFLIVLVLSLIVRHTGVQQRTDCEQLLANFDRYANTSDWNFGNYQSIPSVWAGGELMHLEQINGEFYEAILRGENAEATLGFTIPAYAVSRYPLREMYALDIGNYHQYHLAMIDNRYAPEVQQSITEPVLVPITCHDSSDSFRTSS